MTIVLASKPGLSSATTLSIPKEWDATWFRNLINNQLKGADVRNAVGVNGIKVSGNIASPYASIGFVAPVTIPGPVTITAPATAGSNTLTVNGPTSGVGAGIRLNQTSATNDGLVINGTTGTIGPDIDFTLNSVPKAIIAVASKVNENTVGSAVGDLTIQTQGGNILLSTNSGVSAQVLITTTGVLLSEIQNGNQIALNATGAHFGLISNTAAQTWAIGHAATTNTAITPVISWSNPNALAFFNGAGQGQIAGWGTPTGPAIVANFSGAAATLVNCSNAIAKIITDLKAWGLYAA